MKIYFELLGVFMSLAGLFFLGSALVYYLKQLKKRHVLNWAFLDYISVGYYEHLVNRYIKRI